MVLPDRQHTAGRPRDCCRPCGGAELAADDRFASNSLRVANREELDAILASWVNSHTTAELIRICDDSDVAYCVEYDAADIFADAHYQARGTIETVQDPVYGPMRMPRGGSSVQPNPGSIRWTGEELDASRDEVLSDPSWKNGTTLTRCRRAHVEQGRTPAGVRPCRAVSRKRVVHRPVKLPARPLCHRRKGLADIIGRSQHGDMRRTPCPTPDAAPDLPTVW